MEDKKKGRRNMENLDLHFIHTYNRSVTFVRGEDVYLIDDQGKRYLDMGAGLQCLPWDTATSVSRMG